MEEKNKHHLFKRMRDDKMRVIRQYLFWRKYRGEAKIVQITQIPCSPEIYGIVPNSFKITRENWRKMNLTI